MVSVFILNLEQIALLFYQHAQIVGKWFSVTVCFKNVIWHWQKCFYSLDFSRLFSLFFNCKLQLLSWSKLVICQSFYSLWLLIDRRDLSYQYAQSLLHISLSEMEKLSEDKTHDMNNKLGWNICCWIYFVFICFDTFILLNCSLEKGMNCSPR